MIITKVFLILLSLQNSFGDQAEITRNEVVLHDSLFTNREVNVDLSELKGWRFSAEDNPAFALADLDDSHWYKIESSLRETTSLPDSIWRGFGWLRLRIRVDSSFSKQLNVISPHVMGGSEVYINGQLVLSHGVPDVTAEGQKLLGAVLDLGTDYEFLPGETYQIAVRYSLHHLNILQRISLGSYIQPILLSIFLTNYDTINVLIHRTIITTSIFAFASAILLMVMMLHLFMHLSGAEGKMNFAILILSVCMFLLSITVFSAGFSIRNFWTYIILSSSAPTTLTLVCCSLIPWVTHQVLEVPVSAFWKRFIFIPLILVVFLASFPKFPYEGIIVFIGALIIILAVIGSIQAIFKARKQKKTGIGLVSGSLLAYPILLISIFILVANGLNYFWNSIIIFLMLISMPIGMSIKQAKQFLKLHFQLNTLVGERTAELSKSLHDLREAQAQLIQQEKLASLGQLAAGIAHEIKNPLNFVNNFSEVSIEMIGETLEEMEKREARDETLIQENLEDIQSNLQKIHEHGSRANGIVTSMLQHSRGGSGKKEPTDLNALIKEYVNLSFHGMRAGKNPIDVEIELELDDAIKEIPLVREDFARVIINLCNNAFDAMRQKLNSELLIVNSELYHPKLTVHTKSEKDRIAISVKDNGPGIPDEIKDKILQPFFTTKKGTEGTGLGLSITHDIVRAHGGELRVKTGVGEGTDFQISLPFYPTEK